MNLTFVYDNQNEKLNKFINNFISKIKELKIDVKINIKETIVRVSSKTVYIIVLNNINELINFKNCFKYKEKALVITKDITCDVIYKISNYTSNICYINTEIEILVRRVYEVYKNSDIS